MPGVAFPRSGVPARASLGELIRTLPARQLMLLWLAIFSTFTAIAFMMDIILGGRLPLAWLASMALVSGTLAAGFTATSLRRRWFAFASLVAADIVYIVAVRRLFELAPVAPAGRLVWDAIGTLA